MFSIFRSEYEKYSRCLPIRTSANLLRGIRMENNLGIPALSYFESGNPFTGSLRNTFRFRLAKQESTLQAAVWYTDLCYEKAKNREEQAFELSAEGMSDCIAWIESKNKPSV